MPNFKKETGTNGKYKCDKCKDVGYIFFRDEKGIEYAEECTCQEIHRYERMLKRSGISEAFKNKTLDSFQTDNETAKMIKDKAVRYIENFNENSFATFGQVGAGKTHITIAIANALMEQGIAVRYAQYGMMVSELLNCRFDDINYYHAVGKYQNARVLLIDDLYKGAISEWNGLQRINARHIEIVFDIINYRYLNNKPIIVSSEITTNKLLELDEGIGSRILEMAKGNIVLLDDKKMNRRIYSE